MASQINVYLLPHLLPSGGLRGQTVVVIDVLRASTTITWSLAEGAGEVIPCLEISEARDRGAKLSRAEYLLGGERNGLKIAGFDLGNSPSEYTSSQVDGKTIVFTTTNGTYAMMQCREAKCVLIGAFVNLSAVVAELAGEETISLLCAGTRGEITREDTLLAGCLAERLRSQWVDRADCRLNDQALIALAAWRETALSAGADRAREMVSRDQLAEELKNTQGGRNLQGIGLAADIRDAADIDRFSIVPQLDLSRWTIRATSG